MKSSGCSKDVVQKSIKQLPNAHKWVLSSLVSFILVLALFPSEPASASRQHDIKELEIGKRYELDLPLDQFINESPDHIEDLQDWQSFTVAKGDNLAKIFQSARLSPQETYRVSKAGKDAQLLLKMLPGQELNLLIGNSGKLQALRYPYTATDTLVMKLDDSGSFSTQIVTKNVDTRVNFAQGEISSSFWNAGLKARLSENQIMSLAGIFGWDIDFALELRKGDSFNVIFEEQYIDGEFVGYGDIMAAEFVNQGETYTAVRYEDGNYYTPEGRSMRKSFLRAPVSFKYISSNFKNARFHPVQKRWKAHRGVDYAADRGTPVMAAGDGRVIRSGYDKYNGNHVFIQHGEKYVTKYLHFNKRPSVKTGQSVKQGQTIGYVGSTGLASGPHLHYEFLVDGVHRNPRTVVLPKAQAIEKKELQAFTLLAEQRLEQLNSSKRIMLAMN
jgi:murein DD-endopeptidase MepM/ murein hydrolase activator NlpD